MWPQSDLMFAHSRKMAAARVGASGPSLISQVIALKTTNSDINTSNCKLSWLAVKTEHEWALWHGGPAQQMSPTTTSQGQLHQQHCLRPMRNTKNIVPVHPAQCVCLSSVYISHMGHVGHRVSKMTLSLIAVTHEYFKAKKIIERCTEKWRECPSWSRFIFFRLAGNFSCTHLNL